MEFYQPDYLILGLAGVEAGFAGSEGTEENPALPVKCMDSRR